MVLPPMSPRRVKTPRAISKRRTEPTSPSPPAAKVAASKPIKILVHMPDGKTKKGAAGTSEKARTLTTRNGRAAHQRMDLRSGRYSAASSLAEMPVISPSRGGSSTATTR